MQVKLTYATQRVERFRIDDPFYQHIADYVLKIQFIGVSKAHL